MTASYLHKAAAELRDNGYLSESALATLDPSDLPVVEQLAQGGADA